jgi:thiamine biosynthesis protein ThiI
VSDEATPPSAATHLALLRLSGDISTKARATRHQFVGRLLHNLRDALASEGLPQRIRVSHDRLFAELPDGADPGFLARVFGVQSVSVVERHPAGSLAAVVEAGVSLFRERVAGRRFAVRARRVGDRGRARIRGGEVNRELGAALLPLAAGVDLSNPEVTVHCELHEGEAYFFPESLAGPAGLPLGVEGRAIALISGGFDSAVAAWQLMKRGVALDYAFCNLGGSAHLRGTVRVAKLLGDRWSYGSRPRFHSIDFSPITDDLQAKAEPRYWQVLLKRSMLRAADLIADERRAPALVTGEALGQVSSQTLQNLAVISPASRRMILRPLVGFNKEEIIALAERIGTAELSKVVREYCDLAPRKPATAASQRAIDGEEAKLDLSLIEEAVAQREVHDLRDLDVDKLDLPEIQIDRVPDGAALIDLRSLAEYRGWHHPDALHLDFSQALRSFSSFDRTQTYVLTCHFGLKSAHLAELMRREGFEAFHLSGGIPALRRLLD